MFDYIFSFELPLGSLGPVYYTVSRNGRLVYGSYNMQRVLRMFRQLKEKGEMRSL